ncbi:MAG: TIGR00730 family Rossman fold protein [Actinomycetota bacterium]|nr:TIGR00730 family Rossman fold protein [Actinomycetota bacterium]
MAVAEELGSTLAGRDIGVVYGGGQVGLMGVLADAALAAGGEVIGVMPEMLVRAEIAHQGLTTLEIPTSMHQRKARMADLADGFIAMPGGFGTLDEVLEVLTWNQLGLLSKPVAFLDVQGYFAPLLEFFDRAVESNFVRGAHRMLAQRARSVDEAISLATAPAPDTPHKWLDRDRA